jgi:RNA polymerase sigma factor (sigma-70 family)
MPPALTQLLHRLHRLPVPCPDRVLLDRFLYSRDEAAFTALVSRHGPLVLRLCRRLLRQEQDVEDAFQATFLVLARRAFAIRCQDSLAAWLHGVAYRVASRARAAGSRQRQHEAPCADLTPSDPHADPLDELTARELLAVVDEEVQRLPPVHRLPVILCCLEGKSQEEAARLLGWTPGSVKGRLERGRARLRDRLARRGLTLPAALAVVGIGHGGASAAVSAALAGATARAAVAFAAGGRVAGGVIPHRVVSPAEGAMKAMVASKLKIAAGLVLAAGLLAGGAGWAAFHARTTTPAVPEQEAAPPAARDADPPKPEAEKPPRGDLHGDPLPEGAIARMGTTRFRHAHAAALAFTADGKSLLTCGDRTIRFWDAASGRLLREQPFPPDSGFLAVSADGRLIAFLHFEKDAVSISLWDTERNRLLHKLPVDEARPQFQQGLFTPDGKILVSAEMNGTLRAWDVATGKGWLVGKHESQAWSLCFAADGTLLSSTWDPKGGNDGNRILRLWDVPGGRERARLPLPMHTSEAFLSPDGRTVAICLGVPGESQKGVQFLDAATGKPAEGWIGPSLPRVHSVQFAPDGKTVAISTAEGTLIWDPVAGKRVRSLPGGSGDRLTYSPDGKTLAALRAWGAPNNPRTRAVLVWDVATGAARAGAEQGHLDEVAGVALSPDGRTIASVSYGPYSSDATACLWDAATGRLLRSVPVGRWALGSLVFSPDGKHLFVGTASAILRWEVSTGRETGRYPLFEQGKEGRDHLSSVHLTDDGRTLRAATSTGEGQGGLVGGGAGAGTGPARTTFALHGWEVETGKRLPTATFTLGGSEGDWAGYSHFSADGRLFAVPGGVLCDTATGKEVVRLPVEGKKSGTALAFSPDGALVALGEDPWKGEKVQVWEVATLLPVARLETGLVAHLAFTPDGRHLITAGMEALRLWDLASGKVVASRPAHGGFRGGFGPSFASSLALGGDGRTVATGHPDTTVLLWDLPALSRPASPLPGAELEAHWADLSGADGGRALAALARLTDVPGQAVPLLRDRLRPAQPPSADELRRLLAELDDADFARREAATKRLTELGELAEAALRGALRGEPSPEVRRRVEALLAGQRLVQTPEARRNLRVVRLLEGIGSPEARQLLERLARGAPEARLTREANASLERLARRPGTKP